jgi:hypothetical protein
MRTIANKRIFRRPSFNFAGVTSNGIMNEERVIGQPLNQTKSQLQDILDDSRSAFRQIEVMNQTGLSDLFGGFGFI